jgi:hypothetical protein
MNIDKGCSSYDKDQAKKRIFLFIEVKRNRFGLDRVRLAQAQRHCANGN